MSQHAALVAVYGKHDAVEAAVRRVVEEGLDRERPSIVGRDRYASETAIGSCSASVSHLAESDA